MEAPRVTIHQLTDDQGTDGAAARELLKNAEVIIGVDVMSQREFLVYGRELLSEIGESAAPREVPVLHVELDQETRELEWLCAAVTALKGRHEYEG